MIEQLSQLIELLGDVSEIGGYLAGGFIGYKLVVWSATTGSIVFLSKMFIEKLFSYLEARANKPEVIERKPVRLEDKIITSDGECQLELWSLMDELREFQNSRNNTKYGYVFAEDVRWLRGLIKKEKVEKNGKV